MAVGVTCALLSPVNSLFHVRGQTTETAVLPFTGQSCGTVFQPISICWTFHCQCSGNNWKCSCSRIPVTVIVQRLTWCICCMAKFAPMSLIIIIIIILTKYKYQDTMHMYLFLIHLRVMNPALIVVSRNKIVLGVKSCHVRENYDFVVYFVVVRETWQQRVCLPAKRNCLHTNALCRESPRCAQRRIALTRKNFTSPLCQCRSSCKYVQYLGVFKNLQTFLYVVIMIIHMKIRFRWLTYV